MIVGDVPRRKGSAWGAGLSHEETIAHMSMWVMAASPLLTTVDVRNMTAETEAILTNPELLQIHKDPLGEHDQACDRLLSLGCVVPTPVSAFQRQWRPGSMSGMAGAVARGTSCT